MLYNTKGETYKLVKEMNKVKLYHKAQNRWSSGWTYIGTFKTTERAEAAARSYTN